MTKKIKIILTVMSMLFASQLSFAGATEDLWTALKVANYPNALTAIAAGADVKNLDASFGTPLNLASCWADASVVKALIDAKSEINFVSPVNGNTPLTNAASWGNIEAIKLLLAAGADVKIKNKLGQTMLASAIGSSKLETVKLLVAAGADPKEKYDIMTLKDLTLMNALMGGKEPAEKITYLQTVAGSLSKMGVTFPPSLSNAKESDFNTLEEFAKYLLQNGADPNQKAAGWDNILMQSLDLGKTGIGKALIEGGATFDEKKGLKIKDKLGENGMYPNLTYQNGDFVLAAVLSDQIDFVKLMADKYPKLVTKTYEAKGSMKCSNGKSENYNVEGMDLLMIAAGHGSVEIVKFLIEKGAGKGEYAEVSWALGHDKLAMCPIKMLGRTMAFAKSSGNQEIIDLVKASGHSKE